MQRLPIAFIQPCGEITLGTRINANTVIQPRGIYAVSWLNNVDIRICSVIVIYDGDFHEIPSLHSLHSWKNRLTLQQQDKLRGIPVAHHYDYGAMCTLLGRKPTHMDVVLGQLFIIVTGQIL
jgi:hypothetical protein